MKTNRYKRLPWALALAGAPLLSFAETGTPEVGAAVEAELEATVGEFAPAGEAHRVVRGDTLWDLSERYLGNPWHWPRVWSYNPEIENPHWIFPGDVVRLAPPSGGLPPAPALEEEAFESFENDIPLEVPEVAVVGQIGFHKRGRSFRTDGIITRAALDASGRISNAFDEKELLSEGDRVYLEVPKGQKLREGESYVVFRTEGRIYHPVTEAFMGYFTRILGSVRVLDASPYRKYVVAQIERSFEEIERGDRIGPSLFDFERPVAPRPNPRNLVGRIAATIDSGVREVGQDMLVFVDRGKAHGVEPGNRFQVVRAGDGLELTDEDLVSDLPYETVAELVVLEVHEQTSAALVVNARREFQVGDRVVMRAASR